MIPTTDQYSFTHTKKHKFDSEESTANCSQTNKLTNLILLQDVEIIILVILNYLFRRTGSMFSLAPWTLSYGGHGGEVFCDLRILGMRLHPAAGIGAGAGERGTLAPEPSWPLSQALKISCSLHSPTQLYPRKLPAAQCVDSYCGSSVLVQLQYLSLPRNSVPGDFPRHTRALFLYLSVKVLAQNM